MFNKNLMRVGVLTLFSILLSIVPYKILQAKEVKSIQCLASTIYHEARGEPDKGKIAVAKVVMNRSQDDKYPDKVCHVVSQKGQFSWVKSGGIIPIKYTEKELKIAKQVYRNPEKYDHIIDDKFLYFNTKNIRPKHTRKLVKEKTIGYHNFYRRK